MVLCYLHSGGSYSLKFTNLERLSLLCCNLFQLIIGFIVLISPSEQTAKEYTMGYV